MTTLYLDVPEKKMNWRCILSTFNYDVPERINSINAISWQRYTSMYQKNKVNRRCIMTTLNYDVPEKKWIDAVSCQRSTMTYRKESTQLTLYHDNVVLRCTKRTTWIDAVSWQRNSMTYRKEQTRLMLYRDNVFLWRTWKNKLE